MSKCRILVVDADPRPSQLLSLILNRVGRYEVHDESRFSATLSIARRIRPDVILLDADALGRDVDALSANLENDPLLAHIPIVFLTKFVGRCADGVKQGKRFLTKPLDLKMLFATLGSLCLEEYPEQVAA